MNTPWGPAQSQRAIAPGIIEVSTASHGGLALSAARWQELNERLPGLKSFAGPGWLEEDCDYNLAVLAWPDLWPREDYIGAFFAVRHLEGRDENTEDWKVQGARMLAAEFERKHKADFLRGSMATGAGLKRGWSVWFRPVTGEGDGRVIRGMEYPEKICYTPEELDALEADAKGRAQ